jgi:hypothetical protein
MLKIAELDIDIASAGASDAVGGFPCGIAVGVWVVLRSILV